LVLLTLPALRRRNWTVTISFGSIAPLGGEKLSLVRVPPAATMLTNGLATVIVTVAELSAGF
jgi:hypothetical protein